MTGVIDMAETTEVTIKVSEVSSYATALRSHLTAALAYMRVQDYELADAEIDSITVCLDVIRTYNDRKIREERSQYDDDNFIV